MAAKIIFLALVAMLAVQSMAAPNHHHVDDVVKKALEGARKLVAHVAGKIEELDHKAGHEIIQMAKHVGHLEKQLEAEADKAIEFSRNGVHHEVQGLEELAKKYDINIDDCVATEESLTTKVLNGTESNLTSCVIPELLEAKQLFADAKAEGLRVGLELRFFEKRLGHCARLETRKALKCIHDNLKGDLGVLGAEAKRVARLHHEAAALGHIDEDEVKDCVEERVFIAALVETRIEHALAKCVVDKIPTTVVPSSSDAPSSSAVPSTTQ